MPRSKQDPRQRVTQSFVEAKMFLEFPLAVISKQAEEGAHSMTFEDEITDQSTGERIARRITVTSGKFGLPIAGDMDVLLALMILTSEQNKFREAEFEFSLCEVCRLLKWPDNDGRRMNLLKNALSRWLGVTIYFENARRVEGKWISLKGFGLLDNVELTNTQDEWNPDVAQYLRWNKVVLDAMRAGFISLDWNFYLSLKSATAKRLYRFLSKRFEQGSHWPPYELERFAVNKVGLRPDQLMGDYKRTMWTGMSELMEKGFLHKEPRKEVFSGRGRHTKVQFKRARGWRKLAEPKPITTKKVEPNELEKKLIDLGVARGNSRPTCASSLVEDYPADKIKRCIAFHEDELKQPDKDPGVGKLIASIRSESPHGFVPEQFETVEEKAAKRKAKEQKKAKEREQARQEEEERKRSEDEAKNAFRRAQSQFSQAEREQLEDEALVEEDEFFVRQILEARRKGSGDSMFHQLLWEKSIIPKISGREAA